MGGAGRPLHFFARELLERGARVLFVEVVKSESVVAQENLRVVSFAELGYDENALRRAWFGLDSQLDVRAALSRALDEFETAQGERVVVYGDPFVPFVEWFPLFQQRGYKIVYDALDDFEAFPEIGLYFANAQAEKFLVAHSDFTIAVSTTLVKKLSQWQPHAPIHLLRQGFDAATFRANFQNTAPRSNNFTLGFWGHVNAFNIDAALIEHIARARPQWDFQFIGPLDVDSNLPRVQERLRALPNVKLLGRVAHEELPRYLQTFDVALIPFPDNAFNRARDPLKVYEYLSGYKPVVASHTPQLADMPYVYVAYTPQEFLETVERAANIPVVRDVIEAYLENCTWAARLAQLLLWLQTVSPASGATSLDSSKWYHDAALSANMQEYLKRTEQLLQERTDYVRTLEQQANAQQAHISHLQHNNIFWRIRNLFRQ